MKTMILTLILAFGGAAFGADVECRTDDGSAVVTYRADSMTMEFGRLARPGFDLGAGGQFVAIVGEPEQINPKVEYTSTFEYKLADGQSVQILWNAGQSEILRNIPSKALDLKLFGANGDLIADYPNCQLQ